MADNTILVFMRPSFEEEGLYRASPFEFPETTLGGQSVQQIGQICHFGRRLVVKSTIQAPSISYTIQPEPDLEEGISE